MTMKQKKRQKQKREKQKQKRRKKMTRRKKGRIPSWRALCPKEGLRETSQEKRCDLTCEPNQMEVRLDIPRRP